MPARAARICWYPGCGKLNCEIHVQKAWIKRVDEPERIRGRKLQKIRKRLFMFNPLCALCLAKVPPVVRIAVERDHIVPLGEGGQDTEENTQGLCKECHAQKSAEEAKRGLKKRNYGGGSLA